ncbi:MAG: glycosyltransferase family 2 protein [Candidatus Buchananbacteria bacterium]|jgi:glycosyltransferase involved in cell wall biosynthesis
MKLSIIIPVYNEKKSIEKILGLIEEVELPDVEKEIIIIDDGSTDGTREILSQLKEKYSVIFKERNEGKGSAIRAGFKAATGDMAIIQDADLEYNPQEYPEILMPIINGKADVVYGSRMISSKPHRVLYFWHLLGNRILTTFSNMLSNLALTDMETCYKAFDRQALDYLKDRLVTSGFGIEPEITALVAKGKFRIYEVGISYAGRTYEEGKKINWKDGLAAFWHIIKFNLIK